MKLALIAGIQLIAFGMMAQIETPRVSAGATVEQTVGLTKITVKYSRPNVSGRKVFGDLVPFGEVWRTGANENTTFETSDYLVFGKDTLPAGKYALYTQPEMSSWEIIFYKKTDNWGTPETWNDQDVALRVKTPVKKLSDNVESFTIGINNVQTKSATLHLSWEKTAVEIAFGVPTMDRVTQSITKVMSGPSANDFYRAAEFYYNEGIDMERALEWVNKALDMRPDQPFWMLRKKSQIQAANGDYKGAIETAQISMEKAQAAGNDGYVKQNQASIEEWSKKK